MGKHLDRARILFEQGRYDLAITEIHHELAQEPDCGDSHCLLGRCLTNQQKYQEALIELSIAIRLDPECSNFYQALAYSYLLQERLDVAAIAIKEAMRLDPEEPNYIFGLASILYEEGRKWELTEWGSGDIKDIFSSISPKDKANLCWHESLILIQQAIQLNPEEVDYINLYTFILEKLGKSSLAENYSIEAISLDPENATAHASYGLILLKRGKYIPAQSYFQSALRIDPNMEGAKLGLLESLRAQSLLYRLASCGYKIPNTNLSTRLVPLSILVISICINCFLLVRLDPILKQYLPVLLYWILNKIFPCLTMLSMYWMIFGLVSGDIFNWFLQFDKIGRKLLCQKDFIKASIYGVGVITAMGLILTAIIFPPNELIERNIRDKILIVEMCLGLGLLPFALIPSMNFHKARKKMMAYAFAAIGLGLFSISLNISGIQQTETLAVFCFGIYILLLSVSPIIAIHLNKGW